MIPGLGKGNGARFGVADSAQPLTHMRSPPGKPPVSAALGKSGFPAQTS